MKEKDFFESHIVLLRKKCDAVIKISRMLKKAESEYQEILDIIAKKLGIPKADLNNYGVSEVRQAIEKMKDTMLKNIKTHKNLIH